MITRGGYSNDYEGRVVGTLMIMRGRYSID